MFPEDVRVVLRSPDIEIPVRGIPCCPFVPQAFRAVVRPCGIGGGKVQYVEVVPLILVGPRHRIAEAAIGTPDIFDRFRAHHGGAVAKRFDDLAVPGTAVGEPHDGLPALLE